MLSLVGGEKKGEDGLVFWTRSLASDSHYHCSLLGTPVSRVSCEVLPFTHRDGNQSGDSEPILYRLQRTSVLLNKNTERM